MKKGKKGENEKGPNPYDFSLKKSTKSETSTAKAIPAAEMATAMTRSHGLDKAKRIVEPMTISSFKDKDGNPVTTNEAAPYWKLVFSLLNKGTKNAKAS